MKRKTAELEGALLDAAVAKADGISVTLWADGRGCIADFGTAGLFWHGYSPSTDWGQGGLIVERERITIVFGAVQDEPAPVWQAWVGPVYASDLDMRVDGDGPTPLVAAMRAYVASKLGEEVEL
jgi:hypothetical protein